MKGGPSVSHHFDSAADRADGPPARHGTDGTLVGEGHTGEVFSLGGSGLAWAGRDVTAIALRLPDTALGSAQIALWARISLDGHAGRRQVSRIGRAMRRPLFFNPPETEAELDALNAGAAVSQRPPGLDRHRTPARPPSEGEEHRFMKEGRCC
jgi:hypothetical protein